MHFYHVKAKSGLGIVSSAEEGIPAESAKDAERQLERSIFGEWGKADPGTIVAQVIPTYREFESAAVFANLTSGYRFLIYHRTLGFIAAEEGMKPGVPDLVVQYDLKENPIDVCMETYEAIISFAVNRDYFN